MAKDSLTIRIAAPVREALESAAIEDGRTLSSLINKILADWLEFQKAMSKELERMDASLVGMIDRGKRMDALLARYDAEKHRRKPVFDDRPAGSGTESSDE